LAPGPLAAATGILPGVAQDDSESIRAIHQALDEGINWIDTAAIYGLGHSEEIVGKAVKAAFAQAADLYQVLDALGRGAQDLSLAEGASVREELEGSLQRLGVETIDLYQIHWPNPDEEIEEGWAELARQQKAGKIRWIGVSNFNVEQMKRAQAIAPITSLQPPYSMLRPAIEQEILPYCQANNIGVINYSPMVSGS
jgi:aryl-alcohol dehydrogenase-like predicted oxidoreductase